MGNCCSSDPPPRKEQKQIHAVENISNKENHNQHNNKSVLIAVAETEPLHESEKVEKESSTDHDSVDEIKTENNSVQEQQQQIDEIQEADDDELATSLANTTVEPTHQEQEISVCVDEAAAFFALNDTAAPQQHEADINNDLPQPEQEPIATTDVIADDSAENVESNQIDEEKEQQHEEVPVQENVPIRQEDDEVSEKNIVEESASTHEKENINKAEDDLSQPQQEEIFTEKVPELKNNIEDESVAEPKNQDPELQKEASKVEEERAPIDEQPENIEVTPTKADEDKPEEVEQPQQHQETPEERNNEIVEHTNSDNLDLNEATQPESNEKSEEKQPELNLINANNNNTTENLKPEISKNEEPAKNRVEQVPQEEKNSKIAVNENKNKNTDKIIESWDDDFTIPTEIIKKKFVTELVDAPDDLIQVLVNNNVDARILQILRDNNVDGPRFAQPGFISTFFQNDEMKIRASNINNNSSARNKSNSGSLYLGHLIRIRNKLLADAGLTQLCVLASSPTTANGNSKNNMNNSSKSLLSSSTSSLVLSNNNNSKTNEPSNNISIEQLTETQKQVEIQKLPQLLLSTSTINNSNNNFDSLLSESIKMLEPFAVNNNINNTLSSQQQQQHQVETEVAQSKTGRVCTVLHKTFTKLQKVNRGARGPCLDLCEKLRTTIVSPSNGITKFLSANVNNHDINTHSLLFIPEFKRFLSILRESQNWIARFVPPSENASLSLGTKYFEGLTSAYSEDLKRIQEKLDHAKNEISSIQQQHEVNEDEKIDLEYLREKCKEWYKSYYSSSNDENHDFELKILQLQQNKITTTTKSKEAPSDIFEKNDETLLMNRGECFEIENLQHLLMQNNNNKNDQKIILLEGPCGAGKRTFCKKICRSQSVKGALTIFVDLKKVLSALIDRNDEAENTSDENIKNKIETVTDLLSLVNAPVTVKFGIESVIIKKEIPIVWVLDNYDEVKRESNDVTLNEFLQNFELSVDEEERTEAKKVTPQSTFLRSCDSVILYSSSTSTIRNSFHIIIQRWQKRNMESYAKTYFQQVNNNNNNNLAASASSSLSLSVNPKSPLSSSTTSLSSSYYNTVATKRNADGSTASSFTNSEISALIDQGITNSSLQFPTSLHGIPLFVQLLCEAKSSENKSNNTKLDLSLVCPPFLFHRHIRSRFDQAKIKINYILDSNNTAFVRFINNLPGLYDHILEESSKFAFDEFLAHRGNILSFSIPRDEKLPLWIAVMTEMGILSVDAESENNNNKNDDISTTFSFSHKLHVEFLAALYVASNPILNLLLLPFSNDCENVWVFVCQMCLLKEIKNEEFFKRYLNINFTTINSSNNKNDNNGGKITYQSISTQLLTTHVAGRALTLYKSLSEDDRHSTAREDVLRHSEQCGIKLLIQIAALLPKNLVMDALLEKHGGFMARKAPSQFRWMTEWCGVYGALDVLLWFEGKDRFKKEVLTREACRLAVSRSMMLHQQNIPQIQKCSDFLLPRAGDLSPLDAIAVESTVALQQALRTAEYTLADDDLALNIFFAALEKLNTNPNLLACLALCVDLENSLNTTNWNLARFLIENNNINSKVKNDDGLTKWFLIALALQIAIPEIVEIWNPESTLFERVKFADEVKKRRNGLVLLFGDDQNAKHRQDRDAVIQKLSSPEYSQLMNDAKNRFGSEKMTQFLIASKKQI